MKHDDIDNGMWWFGVVVLLILIMFLMLAFIKVAGKVDQLERISHEHTIEGE